MCDRNAQLQSFTISIATCVVLCATVGCEPAKPTKSSVEPAVVAHHVDENDLNTITLTEKAEQRLGVLLAETKFQEIQRKRSIGGEVVLPPGQTILVSAPIAGTLLRPGDEQLVAPGSAVKAEQELFRFQPLLSAERDVLTPSERINVAQTKINVTTLQIEAERQIESAKVALTAAKIAHDRAVSLLENQAGSQKEVDDAEAIHNLAKEALLTAEARHKFLSEIVLDAQPGELVSWSIKSPVDGLLQRIDAAVGEIVATGDVLFSVIRTSRVWIRVPVYVGNWRDIETSKPAIVSEYGAPPKSQTRAASYVSAPPSASATATTVDVFYELENEDGMLYPGQKLNVTVPLRGQSKSLVVPFESILYDIHGGAWVYQQLRPHTFARRRVSVEYVDGKLAVLGRGPEPGAMVVTEGAAELFGTEFGVGH